MAAYVQESSFLKTLLETLHKAWPLHKNDTYKLRNGPSTFGGHLICMNIPSPPKPHDLDLFSFMIIFCLKVLSNAQSPHWGFTLDILFYFQDQNPIPKCIIFCYGRRVGISFQPFQN